MTPFILLALLLTLAIIGLAFSAGRKAPGLTFGDEGPAIRLDAAQSDSFEVSVEDRTIRGLAVPYGQTAKSGGHTFQFSKGTLKWLDAKRVKLWVRHNPDNAIGFATKLEDRDDGLYAEFSVATGAEGDRILGLVKDGVLDGLSIGLGNGGTFSTKGGIQHAVSVPVMEISLTPAPSFADARTFEDDGKGGGQQGGNLASEIGLTIRKVMFESLEDVPKREHVAAGGRATVREEAAYRFDGVKGDHDFSTDLIDGLRNRNGEALERVLKFMAEDFGPSFADVDTADVTGVNPSRQRPDMYVDRLDYRTPFYDALYKGALTDVTPFIFPKYNSSSGLVGDHTQGVEPTGGAFTVTTQTVTPTAVSGIANITREVWDQGGNPQVSTLIRNEMRRGYREMLEAKAVAVLDAATPTALTLTAGAADDDLVDEFEAKLAALQYIRGGNRFNFMGTQIDLYKALAAAKDAAGRKLLPIYGPQNANGVSQRRFASIEVAGVEATPTWALAATGSVVASSYLLNTEDVHVWASAPRDLTFETRVAYVDIGIWGYIAGAISRIEGVREVTYDPVA